MLYYHGTSLKNALSIEKTGFRAGRSGAFPYTPGVYLGGLKLAREWAEIPLDEGKRAGLVTVELQKGEIFEFVKDRNKWPEFLYEKYKEYLEHAGAPDEQPFRAQTFGNALRGARFDAVVFPSGFAFVLNPRIIKILKVQELTEDQVRGITRIATKKAPMSDLRKKIIRLAYAKPELRKHLLPLLNEGQGPDPSGADWEQDAIDQVSRWSWSRGFPSYEIFALFDGYEVRARVENAGGKAEESIEGTLEEAFEAASDHFFEYQRSGRGLWSGLKLTLG